MLLWPARQRQTCREHRPSPRAARGAIAPDRGHQGRHHRYQPAATTKASLPLLRRPHDHHRDLPTRLLAASPSDRDSAHHQDRHFMRSFTRLPARTVIHRSCWSSISYGSARPTAVLAPRLNHPFSLLDALAPIPGGHLVHSNRHRQQTLSVGTLHHTSPAALKSP